MLKKLSKFRRQYKEKYYSNDNIINDDLDYMPIRSVIYNKDDEKLRNVSL